MNNFLSYCGLVDVSASDLPVLCYTKEICYNDRFRALDKKLHLRKVKKVITLQTFDTLVLVKILTTKFL